MRSDRLANSSTAFPQVSDRICAGYDLTIHRRDVTSFGMETTYKAWDETKRVRSNEFRGSPTVFYTEALVRTHAVGVENGVQAERTVCGVDAWRTTPTQEFGLIAVPRRCGRCAAALGISHIDR